jgi:hypothetical protein
MATKRLDLLALCAGRLDRPHWLTAARLAAALAARVLEPGGPVAAAPEVRKALYRLCNQYPAVHALLTEAVRRRWPGDD